ncbi:MAG: hypothetical protein V7739_21015 [Motiliproteus sp.]
MSTPIPMWRTFKVNDYRGCEGPSFYWGGDYFAMDRFARKLSLYDVPLYKVKHEQEIIPIVLERIKDEIGLENLTIKRVTDSECINSNIDADNCIYIFDVMIGVEESAVLLIDGATIDFIDESSVLDCFPLVLKEENIVESIEVAMFKINRFPEFEKSCFDVLKPEDIPCGCLVFVLETNK